MVEDLKYFDLTGKIIGLSMEIHRNLRGGNFTENIFHRALLKELDLHSIRYESEKKMNVLYKGEVIGQKRLDILINSTVLVEIKVVASLEPIHFNQVTNYLKAFNIEVGLILNFGTNSLQFKRFVNNSI